MGLMEKIFGDLNEKEVKKIGKNCRSGGGTGRADAGTQR